MDMRYRESRVHRGSDLQREAMETLEKDGFSIDYFELCNQHRQEAECNGNVPVLLAAVQPGNTRLINNLEI